MDQTVDCPHCGGRATVEPADVDGQGFVICPWCAQQIPLLKGAESHPPKPAD
jgi:uncharacterized Zn-finger protein